MPIERSLLRLPLTFLIRFLIASSLLSLAWKTASSAYLAIVLPAVNGLYGLEGGSMQLIQRQHELLMLYRESGGQSRTLQFLGYEMIYLNAVAAIALLFAMPGPGHISRLRWTGLAFGLFWALHVFGLYTGGHLALWDYLEMVSSGGDAESGAMALFRLLFAVWSTWGGLALTVTIWIMAEGRYLLPGLEREASLPASQSPPAKRP